jgi:hypothetical protein
MAVQYLEELTLLSPSAGPSMIADNKSPTSHLCPA